VPSRAVLNRLSALGTMGNGGTSVMSQRPDILEKLVERALRHPAGCPCHGLIIGDIFRAVIGADTVLGLQCAFSLRFLRFWRRWVLLV